MSTLAALVHVERRFARSARVDTDLAGSPALTGYILQPSARRVLETLARSVSDGRQYAFTWTGPYGGGKSCAALLLASLVAGSREARASARRIVGEDLATRFGRAFPARKKGWEVLPLTGRRTDLHRELATAAAEAYGWDAAAAGRARDNDRALLDLLEQEAGARDGVLIILDELGKHLDHAAGENGDAHFLQDLAERAARLQGRLVVVGVLHQSFEAYAGRLSKAARDEWAKIQGRYQDIAFVAAADETAALLAQAITAVETPADAIPLAAAVAEAVAQQRAIDADALAQVLAAAWPLHPVTTLLLGSVSRQRFAQNERSVFGFLTSSEPYGFQDHLARTDQAAPDLWFGPDRLWDYLAANFSTALAAGHEGGRFSLAVEAVERALLHGPLHGCLAKSAAVIDLFRAGTGLTVSDMILAACVPTATEADVSNALTELVERAVLVRQPRLGGYALFAGSDFNLDEAMSREWEAVTPQTLLELPTKLGIARVAAKRAYVETGALRTFELVLQLGEECGSDPKAWANATAERIARDKRRASGILVLLVPDGVSFDAAPESAAKALSDALEGRDVVASVGVGRNVLLLREHAADLYALDRVEARHPQMEGDRIARRELAARRQQIVQAVRRELQSACETARWTIGGKRRKALDGAPLAAIASATAKDAYAHTPVIQSELLNRDRPSTSAMAALRALMHAMASKEDQPELGMLDGFPAERGLYLTVIAPFGLHRIEGGRLRFTDPDEGVAADTLRRAWSVANGASRMTIEQLYLRWAAPPIGLKRGVMAALAWAFLLARRGTAALYIDGAFQTALDDVVADRILQTPAAVEFRRIRRSKHDADFLDRLAQLLCLDRSELEVEALVVAQSLHQRFKAAPAWAQRTLQLPTQVRAIRDAAIKANDPEALLFRDLPELLKEVDDPAVACADALAATEGAYSVMLASLRERLAEGLSVDADTFEGVGPRAAAAHGVTGDLRFDSFAMRLAAFEEGPGDIEGLASLLIHRPARGWSDRDRDQAEFELAKLTKRFREAEALARVRGRDATMQAISVVVGVDPKVKPLFKAFEVTLRERREAEVLADKILAQLTGAPSRAAVELAALARVLERLAQPSEADAA